MTDAITEDTWINTGRFSRCQTISNIDKLEMNKPA